MLKSLSKTYIFCILIIFLSLPNIFAQESGTTIPSNADIYRKPRIAAIATTLSVGLTLQFTGIALVIFSQQYYTENRAAILAGSDSASTHINYLATGSFLLFAGTASSLAGIIMAIMDTRPKAKRSLSTSYSSNSNGSFTVSASDNTDLHFLTNAWYVNINY